MDVDSLAVPIEKAFSAKSINAVALVINSPGGSPVHSMLIAEKIRYWSEKKKKPVYAFTLDVAASGGYWLACAADEIYAAPSSIVGSIGVVSAGFGFPELLEKLGVERRIYTAGKNKAMLDPFLRESKQDISHLRDLQKDIHEQFYHWVIQRRGKKLNEPDREQIFSGRFWTGRKAVKLGLVDGEGSLETIMRKKFGKNVRFQRFAAKRGFSIPFLSGASLLAGCSDFLYEQQLRYRLGCR